MADFTTEAELSIVVPDRELRAARDDIENALADIPVGIGASSSRRGGGGGGLGGLNERRRRREFQLARERTDTLDAQLQILENIESELSEGGRRGGGDGGGRNLLRIIGGGLGGAALGVGALQTTLDNFTWPNLPRLDKPGWIPPDVPEPNWLPLDIPTPDPLEVVDPDPVEVSDPDPLEVVDPDPVEVADTDPLEVEDPGVVEVEQPDPIEIALPDISPEQILGSALVGAGAAAGVAGKRFLGGRLPQLPTGGGFGTSGGFGIPAPGFLLGDRAAEAQRKDPDERGYIDRKLAGLVEGFGQIGGGPTVAALGGGGQVSQLAGAVARVGFGAVQDRFGGGGGARPQVTAGAGDVNVTVNADVGSVVQEAVDELRREQERQREELRRDLEQQISDLERQISGGAGGGRIR